MGKVYYYKDYKDLNDPKEAKRRRSPKAKGSPEECLSHFRTVRIRPMDDRVISDLAREFKWKESEIVLAAIIAGLREILLYKASFPPEAKRFLIDILKVRILHHSAKRVVKSRRA